MKITIDIPRNDYIQPTDVRPEVVELICKAFLYPIKNGLRPFFHSRLQGKSPITDCVWFSNGVPFGFTSDKPYFSTKKFNGAEMRAAFQALIEAGYHMFHGTQAGFYGYFCDKKPYVEGAYEVFEFNDFID